jgi:hypothetical protein
MPWKGREVCPISGIAEIEQIVFNSNGDAKTKDLAKAWRRARLEELVQQMRAEFKGHDATRTTIEKLRTFAELKCKFAATRLHANDLIDLAVIPFYGPVLPADMYWVSLLDRRRHGQEELKAT